MAWLMFFQTMAAFLQTGILFVTAVIVWRYTKETQLLRFEAQKQVEAAHQQIRETQRQIEVQQRPFVIVAPEEPQGDLQRLRVYNIGNSAAINIRIRLEGEPSTLPFLPQGEHVAGPVIPIDRGGQTQGLHATQRRRSEQNPYDLRFPLRDTWITDGVQFTVEYHNVAMQSYETVEKLWPRGFEIIHSGKRGADL